LDGANNYSTFNFNFQVNGNANNTQARIQFIPSYHCPSDPIGNRFLVASVIDAASANYMQCLGSHATHAGYNIGTPAIPNLLPRLALHGAFTRNFSARMRDFVDGTSNTALFSEIKKGPNAAGSLAAVAAGSLDDFRVATRPLTVWTGNDLLSPPADCENRATTAWMYRGLQYYRGLLVATYYNHTLTPNARLRDCIMSGLYQGHIAARSHHIGGVHTLLGDGGVRFVSDNVDATLWRSVGTLNNGEVQGEF
jgi:hypothetical protein